MRGRTLAPVLALALLPVLGPTPEAQAGPGWSVTRSRTGATLGAATLAARFTMISGPATGGGSFFTRSLVFGETNVLRLENTGSVPVALTTTATLKPVVSGTIEVWECSTAFASGNCPAGSVATLLSRAFGLVHHVEVVTTNRVVPVGGAVYLKVALTGGVYNEASLTTAVSRTRPALDRSAG